MLNLDDSGDRCSSSGKAGAQRQYLGRLGKVDMGQVGVVASDYRDGIWALVDAELFLPNSWFTKKKKRVWTRFHIPPERTFASKLELALERIDHAMAQGLPFEVVGADTWYDRDGTFRDRIAEKGLWYMLSVPGNTDVYLTEPQIGVPPKPKGQRGRACRNETNVCSMRTLPSTSRSWPSSWNFSPFTCASANGVSYEMILPFARSGPCGKNSDKGGMENPLRAYGPSRKCWSFAGRPRTR